MPHHGFNRREFLQTTALVGGVLALRNVAMPQAHATVPDAASTVAASAGTDPLSLTLRINGETRNVIADPRTTLLDVLRERLGMTGTKKGCDMGACGACTVHVDGKRVVSCLTLAAQVEGQSITTIEGLASGETLHPMQVAFIEHDGFQ